MSNLALSSVILILLSCIHSSQLQAVDLTLVAGSSGSAVVHACISKLSEASIFSSDQQLLRRIAYAETRDGEDSDTYSDPTNDGGIWQLSSFQYDITKSVSSSLLQSISTEFGITWTSTSWSDLRTPLYSAIAARLYLEVIAAPIPLQIDTNGQANYWVDYYTSSGDTAADFVTAIIYLQANEECNVSGLDLIFVMDASGSVGFSNFQLMKEFVYNITNSFEIGSDNVRVGVMSYGSTHTFHFHLNTYTSKSSVLSAISSLPYSSGGTNTAGALDAVRTTGFTTGNGARPTNQGVPRIAIVITDGVSNSYTATVSSAMALHNAGIIGFGIGIAGANVNELNAIASDANYVAFLSSFDSNLLSNLQVTISQEACTASPELTADDEVTSVIEAGEVKYFNYPLPDTNDTGITVKLNVNSGSYVTCYASTVVETPNEAIHDVILTTDGYEDAYIDPKDLSNPDTAVRVYIAIESDSVQSSSVTVSIDNGDTSTDAVSVVIYPSAIPYYLGSEVTAQCYATGKPQPTVNWYKNGTLLSNNGEISVVETIISSTNVSSLLTIASLTKSHEGNYTCSGRNTLPTGQSVSNSSSFNVTVQEESTDSPSSGYVSRCCYLSCFLSFLTFLLILLIH